MDNTEKRSPPDKKLQKAIKYLEEEYERAKALDFVISPICYALYRTWKRFDENEYRKEYDEFRK